MIALFNHSLLTSFYSYLDFQICNVAQGYVNYTGVLYPQINPSIAGNVYASTFKEWIADSCVNGAIVPSGIWNASGQFLTRTSGIVFDFNNGRIISPQKWGGLSGAFARKEFNIYLSTDGEVDWWLENVYKANKDLSYVPTGMPAGYFAAPCIILTNSREENKPWGLGGSDDSKNTIRAYTISPSNNLFLQEGVNSIMRDMAHSSFSLLGYGDRPFNSSGDLKNASYCYSDVCAQNGPPAIYVEAVHDIRLNQNANRAASFMISVTEFDLSTIRTPRTSH